MTNVSEKSLTFISWSFREEAGGQWHQELFLNDPWPPLMEQPDVGSRLSVGEPPPVCLAEKLFTLFHCLFSCITSGFYVTDDVLSTPSTPTCRGTVSI